MSALGLTCQHKLSKQIISGIRNLPLRHQPMRIGKHPRLPVHNRLSAQMARGPHVHREVVPLLFRQEGGTKTEERDQYRK